MNQKHLATLHLAGDLLSQQSQRCTGTSALDKDDLPVSPIDPTACKWCLTGALAKACLEMSVTEPKEQVTVYQAMKEVIGIPLEIPAPLFWDDNSDLHEVVAGRLRKAEG
jgi:hypothetical protein